MDSKPPPPLHQRNRIRLMDLNLPILILPRRLESLILFLAGSIFNFLAYNAILGPALGDRQI